MNKSEGLKRLAKFVHYFGLAVALPLLVFAFWALSDFTNKIVALVVALILYFIFRGISWIIEGFAKD